MSINWPLRKSKSTEIVCHRRLSQPSTKYGRLTGKMNYGYGSQPSTSENNEMNSGRCECISTVSYPCSYCNMSSKNGQSNGTMPNTSRILSSPRRRQMSITVVDSGEHCHDDEAQKAIDKAARKKLWIASILCVLFMIVEAIGGILAGSLAVATDAAHLLTDFAGFMISLFALYISERPATKRLSYGYHRAEVIGALTSVLLIWVVTGILIYMAIQRIVNKTYEIDAEIMLITSGIGVLVNIIMGCTLHQHAHSHGGSSHGHSHDKPKNSRQSEQLDHDPRKINALTKHGRDEEEGPNGTIDEVFDTGNVSDSSTSTSSESPGEHHKQNINVRAAFIHVLGDFFQSIGVFIAALIIYFRPDFAIADPICTFLFSVIVLGTTYAIIKDAIVVLMEGIPKGIDFNEVKETLLGIKGVHKVHNLRIWSISMDRIALSAHLAIDPSNVANANHILRKASQRVRNKYGFAEVTIQIEDFSERMEDCIKCKELN